MIVGIEQHYKRMEPDSFNFLWLYLAKRHSYRFLLILQMAQSIFSWRGTHKADCIVVVSILCLQKNKKRTKWTPQPQGCYNNALTASKLTRADLYNFFCESMGWDSSVVAYFFPKGTRDSIVTFLRNPKYICFAKWATDSLQRHAH